MIDLYPRLISQEVKAPAGCPWFARPVAECVQACYLRVQTLCLRLLASFKHRAFLLTDEQIANHMIQSIQARADLVQYSNAELVIISRSCDLLLKQQLSSEIVIRAIQKKVQECAGLIIKRAAKAHLARRKLHGLKIEARLQKTAQHVLNRQTLLTPTKTPPIKATPIDLTPKVETPQVPNIPLPAATNAPLQAPPPSPLIDPILPAPVILAPSLSDDALPLFLRPRSISVQDKPPVPLPLEGRSASLPTAINEPIQNPLPPLIINPILPIPASVPLAPSLSDDALPFPPPQSISVHDEPPVLARLEEAIPHELPTTMLTPSTPPVTSPREVGTTHSVNQEPSARIIQQAYRTYRARKNNLPLWQEHTQTMHHQLATSLNRTQSGSLQKEVPTPPSSTLIPPLSLMEGVTPSDSMISRADEELREEKPLSLVVEQEELIPTLLPERRWSTRRLSISTYHTDQDAPSSPSRSIRSLSNPHLPPAEWICAASPQAQAEATPTTLPPAFSLEPTPSINQKPSISVPAFFEHPLPLEGNRLNTLFHPENKAVLTAYGKYLSDALKFLNKLCTEKLSAASSLWETRLQEANVVFTEACREVHHQSEALHQECLNLGDAAPEELADGTVLCTARQLEWLTSLFSKRFPALYAFAFDAPTLEIEQTQQMTALARSILVGPSSTGHSSSVSFIRLRDTQGRTTPDRGEQEKEFLLKQGSFIQTHLIGSKETPTDPKEMRALFSRSTEAYVKDWFARPGTSLQFGTQTIQGGAAESEEWVAHLRDHYTQTLLNMEPEALGQEVARLNDCPLVKLAVAAHPPCEGSSESALPESTMASLLEEEWTKAEGKPDLQRAIRRTFENARFAREEDLFTLAKKAGCSVAQIEPLIRIRILYVMACFNQNAFVPLNVGFDSITRAMVDPLRPDECFSYDARKERILSFDERLDKLDIHLKLLFTDSGKRHPVAEGTACFSISSITNRIPENVDINLVDLQDLKFSLYPSKPQQMHLAAQCEPTYLKEEVANLVTTLDQLSLCKKGARYRQAKEEHLQSWFSSSIRLLKDACSFVGLSTGFIPTGFDPESYRQQTQDKKEMALAIECLSGLVSSYMTSKQLVTHGTLSQEQQQPIKETLEKSLNKLRALFPLLKDLYPNERSTLVLSRILNNVPEEEFFEPLQLENENPMIGENATPATARGLLGNLYDYSLGLALNETRKKAFLTWKIKRYEALIQGATQAIRECLQNRGLNNLDVLIKSRDDEGYRRLAPVLKLCGKSLQTKNDRLTPEYLNEVRLAHQNELLTALRDAAQWAERHSHQPSAHHIDAICYALYTQVDINACTQEVLETFKKLGKEALQSKGKEATPHQLFPQDSRYDLIRELEAIDTQIRAAPNDAKAPKIKQWLNSFRGHVNGIWGVTDFDPNMQSNPMHVLFNTQIQSTNSAIPSFSTKHIAMGSPTIEQGNGTAILNPEFRGFLRHSEREGHFHLYFNQQNYIPKSLLEGDESVRCQTLHNAERDFPKAIAVVTLSQNSPFHYQRGHDFDAGNLNIGHAKQKILRDLYTSPSFDGYIPSRLLNNPQLHNSIVNMLTHMFGSDTQSFTNPEQRTMVVARFHEELRKEVSRHLTPAEHMDESMCNPSAQAFKREMAVQLFDRPAHETGNCISANLVQRYDLRNWTVQAIEKIHQQEFGSRQLLTAEEKRIFVRLVYESLGKKIVIETRPTTLCKPCKDNIDRGAKTRSEDFASVAILGNMTNEPEVIEFFETQLFSRAIMVRKRSIIHERLEGLIETVKFMVEQADGVRKVHHALFPGIEMKIDLFENRA